VVGKLCRIKNLVYPLKIIGYGTSKQFLCGPIAKCVENKNTKIAFVSLGLLLFVCCYNKKYFFEENGRT